MRTTEEFNEYCRGKSIAIVGEAESMLGLGNGEAIDAHDVVVRFSRSAYPPEAYWPDTGRKIDVWSCAICCIETLRIGWERIWDRIDWILWAWVNANTMPIEDEFRAKVVKLPPMHIANLSASIGNQWATNGLAVLAWFWCETEYASIDVYGFDFLKTGCWSAHADTVTGEHKSGRPDKEGNTRHDGAKEKAWVKANMARDTKFHGVEL